MSDLFHVRIETDRERPWATAVFKTDMTESELLKQFINPYESGTPIVVSGQTINLDDIVKMSVAKSDHLFRNFRWQKIGLGGIGGPSFEWRAFGLATDVTDQYITIPAGTKSAATPAKSPSMPSVFISYAWESDEHKEWVKGLADKLRSEEIVVSLDRWELVPGDQIPEYMESAVRQSDFVLVVCTPTYKEKSDLRTGGVGYEGDIITGELMGQRNHRKFIPIHRSGTWESAAPSWVKGKYYVDFTTEKAFERYYSEDLLPAITGKRKAVPDAVEEVRQESPPSPSIPKTDDIEVKITGININDVGTPKNDGTAGSGLYSIPFQLNRIPPSGWASLFRAAWDRPEITTPMHRPGIAEVYRDKIVLTKTTVEEVGKYHRDTLILAVETANEQLNEQERMEQEAAERERQRLADHRQDIEEQAKDIMF